MTNAEREKRLAEVRASVEDVPEHPCEHFDDAAFLLEELDAALLALHDLREETGWAEGYRAGKEAGAKEEREKIGMPVFRFSKLTPEQRAELTRALGAYRDSPMLVLPGGPPYIEPTYAAACLSHPEHDWGPAAFSHYPGHHYRRCGRCGRLELFEGNDG